jgi:hypothetical protein
MCIDRSCLSSCPIHGWLVLKIDKQMQNEVWWYNYYLQNFTFQINNFFRKWFNIVFRVCLHTTWKYTICIWELLYWNRKWHYLFFSKIQICCFGRRYFSRVEYLAALKFSKYTYFHSFIHFIIRNIKYIMQ